MPNQISRYDSFDSAELYATCRSTVPNLQATAYKTLWNYMYQVALQVVYDQPDAEALAQDCAQIALVRIHERITECREPAAFRTWTRRIASRVAIDELRRRKRLLPIDRDNPGDPANDLPLNTQPSPETTTLEKIREVELSSLIIQAPISNRSRRVVLGRYLDDLPDELLARTESKLADQTVLPSHIQVTRSKNITKLRDWEPLQSFLERTG